MGEWIIHPPTQDKRAKRRSEAGDCRVMSEPDDGTGRIWMLIFIYHLPHHALLQKKFKFLIIFLLPRKKIDIISITFRCVIRLILVALLLIYY